MVQRISIREKMFIGSDINGHVKPVVMNLIVNIEDLVLEKEIK